MITYGSKVYDDWVKTTNEKIAETNSRIRRTGGTLYFDMGTGLWMITVTDAAPVPAYKHTEEYMRQHKIAMAMTRREHEIPNHVQQRQLR